MWVCSCQGLNLEIVLPLAMDTLFSFFVLKVFFKERPRSRCYGRTAALKAYCATL